MGLMPDAHSVYTPTVGAAVERDLDGLWFFGRVVSVAKECVTVMYEDGVVEEGVLLDEVRPCPADGRMEDWASMEGAKLPDENAPVTQSKYEGEGRYELGDGSVLLCHSDQQSNRAAGGSGLRGIRFLKNQNSQ
jgi:hypothetical protein